MVAILWQGSSLFWAEDMWILKLDQTVMSPGKKPTEEVGDYARSIQQTSDGGYIVAGDALSFGAGSDDMWILKLDSDRHCLLAENLWG